jgi:S1-C subfamily serine protease
MKMSPYQKLFVALLILAQAEACFGQADPASEPAVLAVAKVLPAVVNINSERVVRRTVRDPFEDVYAQFFGYNRVRPREIRQTLQSLGSGFIIDPAGYIITNQHVVERAADLKIHVTTNDGKTYSAHYIAGDDKTDLAFIKIDAETAFPFISLDNISPNLLGQTVIVVGNAVGYGSSISRGVLSAVKRNITVDDTEYKVSQFLRKWCAIASIDSRKSRRNSSSQRTSLRLSPIRPSRARKSYLDCSYRI